MTKRISEGMQFTISKEAALKACAHVLAVAERKAETMPAVTAVRIDAVGKKIATFSAYDLEIGVRATAEVEVDKSGSVAVPARWLASVVKDAPENMLTVSALENNRVQVSSGSMLAELAGLDPKSVDVPEAPSTIRLVPLNPLAMRVLILGVRDAVSDDETRVHLTGALIERTRIGWLMVATDGHRLSQVEQPIDESQAVSVEERVFLSAKSLDVLNTMIGTEADGQTGAFGFTKTVLVFEMPGVQIVARLQEDCFPAWRQAVPEASKHEVIMSRKALADAVARMRPISAEVGHKVVLHLGRNVLKLRAEADVGHISDRVTIEHDGPDATLALNSGYLLDALKTIEEVDSIELGIEDSVTAVTIRPPDKTAGRFVWVLMPMRVEDADARKITAEAGEDIETVFKPFRKTFQAQNAKKDAVEAVCKHARGAARTHRKMLGRPLVEAEKPWPSGGYWTELESTLGREIPDDERDAARRVFWEEACKAWPVGEPTREQLEEVERIGKKAGDDMLKAMGGNKLTVSDRRGRLWPEPSYWQGLEKELNRQLTEAEREACRDAYYDACAVEDDGQA